MEEEPQPEVEVPCYFLCPISLHIMRDPVTLPTGITYDRDGIERWLLTAATCPLTKQPVPADCDPTPNHTLRRLIQSWCALHHHHHAADGGVDDRAHTPPERRPTDRARVAALVSRVQHAATTSSSSRSSSSAQQLLAALRELRDVADESDRNRDLVAAIPGAVDVLAAVFAASANTNNTTAAVCDEALEVISSLHVPEQCLRRVAEANESLVDALVSALRRPDAACRARAAVLLERVTAAMPPSRLASLPEQVFKEAVELVRDRPGPATTCSSRPAKATTTTTTTKAALHVLVRATAWGRNRVKAVDAGAVAVLVDMLFDDGQPERQRERRACELALAALDRLCGCAEGRAELVAHGAGVAAVGKKAIRVSEVATDKAVRVLRSVARHAATAAVVQEMAQAGVVGTLCVVAHSEQYGERTRERARETLRLHARAWRNSPCLHHHLQAMYPC